jgi:hypothetical protein
MPQQYDVLIHEIMADPTPVVGLPGNEWIELRNVSPVSIDLKGWRIGDATGLSGSLPAYPLLPHSFVIICTRSAEANMSLVGPTIAVTGFPALDNNGEQLFLQSAEGKIIHTVNFTISWYQNTSKKEGGWSLEMIDPNNPCGGMRNWSASEDVRGGTPGIKNSVIRSNPDLTAPRLQRAFASASNSVTLVFDEPLDSSRAATATYTISNGIGQAKSAFPLGPLFNEVRLELPLAMQNGNVYTITVNGLSDCAGNPIGAANTTRVGLAEKPGPQDLVINEILFNPPPTGTDYVELYNRGTNILDLKETQIATRDGSGVISAIKSLGSGSYLLFPGDFVVITESAALVQSAYITQNREWFIEVPSLPSFNDNKGTVVIMDALGKITDELTYSDQWHFKLVDNKEGVSLERIDYNAPTQSAGNWHSAATSVGYGTPTYKNSQVGVTAGVLGEMKLSPEIISPDNDGQDDFATLNYNFPEPGYVANITIFDAQGRVARYLIKNGLCGTSGSFKWDGLGEKSRQLPTGVYVVFTEIFNLSGNKKQFKMAVVVFRKI